MLTAVFGLPLKPVYKSRFVRPCHVNVTEREVARAPLLTQVSGWAHAGIIESRTLTVASILAVHLQTGILVDFTVSACTNTRTERVL